MSTANLDAVDLKDVNLQGWIHEDVMNQIFNISRIPLPFTDAVGSSSHDNQYFSWNVDKLSQPVTDGQTIDGADITPGVGSTGERMGNHSEIRTKSVAVSTRAQEVDSIGFGKARLHGSALSAFFSFLIIVPTGTAQVLLHTLFRKA